MYVYAGRKLQSLGTSHTSSLKDKVIGELLFLGRMPIIKGKKKVRLFLPMQITLLPNG